MNEIPIHVIFEIDDAFLPMDFTEENNVNLNVELKTSYRQQKPMAYYMGSGYLGDTFANRLI